MKKENSINRFWIGLVASLILPFLFALLSYETFLKTTESFFKIVPALYNSPLSNILGKFILYSIIPNLGLFFIFYKKEYWDACRGLIFGTTPYFIFCIYLMT